MKNTPDLMQRGGQFKISSILTVRCEQHYMSDSLHYVAFSPHFEIVPEGCVFPEYTIEVCQSQKPCRCDNCAHKPSFTVRKL